MGGPEITRTDTATGTHTIEVTATNSERVSDSDSVSITVTPNARPLAQITSPRDRAILFDTGEDAQGNLFADVQLTAEASDPDGDPLTYRWIDSVDGGAPKTVSNILSPRLRLRCGSHALTLAVSDAIATPTTDTVRIEVCPTPS